MLIAQRTPTANPSAFQSSNENSSSSSVMKSLSEMGTGMKQKLQQIAQSFRSKSNQNGQQTKQTNTDNKTATSNNSGSSRYNEPDCDENQSMLSNTSSNPMQVVIIF